MPYTPILGSLGYILSPDRKRTLLVHRTARKDDDHLGKYNGLGGKMLPEEDIVQCMKRELMEEAGIDVLSMSLRGTINWTGFGPKAENWLGFIFLIDKISGTPFKSNEEGNLDWHLITELENLPLWDGDRHFLPMVFDEDPRAFHGYMPYDGDRALSWTYTRI